MIEHIRKILTGQMEAALSMTNLCIAACPPQHWEGKVANATFRQVAYHTLFYADLYLSPTEAQFELLDLHKRGGDERGDTVSPGLSKEGSLQYAGICREKAVRILASETPESLQGPSGFSWRTFSRGELHVYNTRHIQHHTGQLTAYLRRVDQAFMENKALPWVASGWR
ncbi:MAG TPA: DinB family protein [Tepidisphaeraceae bacterium]|jgi:uncharacterized damage-inducible protein DinB|nr:DinB family protein [Tepidisphaeraceae bacterium]